jgi:hypothetical protein
MSVISKGPRMTDDDRSDPQFDAMTARLLRREALRRAAEELNTTSGPGLEGILARISAEMTAQAASVVSGNDDPAKPVKAVPTVRREPPTPPDRSTP